MKCRIIFANELSNIDYTIVVIIIIIDTYHPSISVLNYRICSIAPGRVTTEPGPGGGGAGSRRSRVCVVVRFPRALATQPLRLRHFLFSKISGHDDDIIYIYINALVSKEVGRVCEFFILTPTAFARRIRTIMTAVGKKARYVVVHTVRRR